MPHRLKLALLQEKDRQRAEARGRAASARLGLRVRVAAIRAWERTRGDPMAVVLAVESLLGVESRWRELVADAMTVGHLNAVIRVGATVAERRDRGLRLSGTTYDNALELLRKRLGVKPDDLRTLRDRYGEVAADAVRGQTEAVQKQVYQALQDSISAGDGVREGVQKLRQAFTAAGVTTSSGHLLETTFRTNVQLAYSAGRMQALADPAVDSILWGYEYVSVGDSRVRPTHAEMDGTRAPKDDPVWQSWTPPNGYNCRCALLEIFDQGTPTKIPAVQPDAGFAFNPGRLVEDLEPAPVPGVTEPPVLSPATSIVHKHGEEKTRTFLQTLGLDQEAVLRAAVGSAGSLVKEVVITAADDVLFVAAHGDGDFTMQRAFYFDPQTGQKVMEQSLFLIGEANQGKGLGSRIFHDQVLAAEKAGIVEIRTSAAGNKNVDQNGYYTWPRLGYDGKLPFSKARRARALFGSDRVGDLMATPEGRDWWKENGGSLELTFDPREGSLNRRVLDAYVQERKAKNA